jgi:hypothetical protein
MSCDDSSRCNRPSVLGPADGSRCTWDDGPEECLREDALLITDTEDKPVRIGATPEEW